MRRRLWTAADRWGDEFLPRNPGVMRGAAGGRRLHVWGRTGAIGEPVLLIRLLRVAPHPLTGSGTYWPASPRRWFQARLFDGQTASGRTRGRTWRLATRRLPLKFRPGLRDALNVRLPGDHARIVLGGLKLLIDTRNGWCNDPVNKKEGGNQQTRQMYRSTGPPRHISTIRIVIAV